MLFRCTVSLGFLFAVAVSPAAESTREIARQFKLSGSTSMGRLGSRRSGWSYPFWFPNRPKSNHKNWKGTWRSCDMPNKFSRKKSTIRVEIIDFGTGKSAENAVKFAANSGYRSRAAAYRQQQSWTAYGKFRRDAEFKRRSVHGNPQKPTKIPPASVSQHANLGNITFTTLEFQGLDGGIKAKMTDVVPLRVQTARSHYIGYVDMRRRDYYQKIGVVPENISDSRMDPANKYCYETTETSYVGGRVLKGLQLTYVGRRQNLLILIHYKKSASPQRVQNRPGMLRQIDYKDADVGPGEVWAGVVKTFFRLCGGKDLPFESEREGTRLNLNYRADLHVAKTVQRENLEFQPAAAVVRGRVLDVDGKPIPGALVSVSDPPMQTVSNARGEYYLRVPLGGSGPWRVQQDVKLEPNIEGLQCVLETPKPLVANGRGQTATFVITADGKPLADREVRIDLPPKWFCRGYPVAYLQTTGAAWRPLLKTDKNGRIKVDAFPVPVTVAGKLGRLQENQDEQYFPAIGKIVVTDIPTEKKCEATYVLDSPYPDVRKFRLMAVQAGSWQGKEGSELIIDDPDSNEFEIDMRVAGRVRIPPGKDDYLNKVSHQLEGKRLFFHYQAPKWGDDLTKQPKDMWTEFGTFNLKLAGKYFIDVGGSLLLKSCAVQRLPKGVDPNSAAVQKTLQFQASQTGEVYDLAKGKWAMVELGDKMDAFRDDIKTMGHRKELSRKDIETQAINTMDLVIGVIETGGMSNVQILKGTPIKGLTSVSVGVSKMNVQVEVLKVVYENAKFMHKLHQQFTAIANATQGTEFAPILVTIKDADGYEITAMRHVTIRTWEKEK